MEKKMKKMLLLLFVPLSNAYVVDVTFYRDNNNLYKQVCVAENAVVKEGYLYLITHRLMAGSNRVNLDLQPVVVQMYEKNENGGTSPISCKV